AAVETPDTEEVASDDDWMKQMEDLDEETTELAAVETPDTEEVTNDDDWMKQMEDLDEETTNIKEVAGDDDWMSQMEGLGEEATGADEDSSTDNVLKSNFNASKEPANKIEAPDTEAQDQAIAQLRADQDIIQGENKTQFADAESKRKKTAIFSYIALSLGVIGLLGSAGVGWLSYDGKSKSEELAQSVTALEEKVDGFFAKNPEKEIENLKASVEQLNQKVEKVAAAQVVVPPPEVVIAPIEQDKNVTKKNAGKVSSLIASLKHKTSQTSPGISTPKVVIDSNTIPPINIAPEHIVPENIVEEKSDESPKLKELAKKPIEVTKVEKTPEVTKVEKTPEATKAEAELLSQTIAKADAVAKAASAVQPVYTGRMTRGMAYSGEKNLGEVTKSKTPIESQKAVPVGKYSVNVVSYQQEWFAQSKAAEFKQNGIPVEVVPVNIGDNATRYRLKVTGFKTKSDASAYAEQIKKSHNLNEAWVGSGSNE
ncbi:MAG: SPOR domain-containing protein, partial [Methylococcales bacterium]|nr:SPOR domain-containing protein [Methylococcales bacterium]